MHFLTPKQELTIYLVGTTSGFTPSPPQITPRLKSGSRFYNHLLLAVATLPEEIFFKPPTTVEVGLVQRFFAGAEGNRTLDLLNTIRKSIVTRA